MSDYKCIDEDTVAHGARLAFPNIQSCIAAIAVLPNELLGYHFTLKSLSKLQEARTPSMILPPSYVARATLWLEKASEYLGGQKIRSLYLVGNAPGYDLQVLRNIFVNDLNGSQAIPSYSYDIYSAAEKKHAGQTLAGVTVFAEHAGANSEPKITYKRESKVTITNKRNHDESVRDAFIPAGMKASSLTAGKYFNQDATFTVKNVHGLRRNFTAL